MYGGTAGLSRYGKEQEPLYERFRPEMYRKNPYASNNTNSSAVTVQQKTEQVKSYSSLPPDDEDMEGVSTEGAKPGEALNTNAAPSPDDNAIRQINLELDSDSLLQGILLSEILGKPLAKRRRGRW
jgi:hypothetical protein